MLGSRLPKSRRFSYTPLYYDPKKEEREGRRIKFRRQKSRSAVKTRSLIWLFVLLAVIFYIVYFLKRIG